MHLDLRFSFLQHILKCQKDKWCSLLNVSALNSLKKISLSFILRVTACSHPPLRSRLRWCVCPSLFFEQKFGGDRGLDSQSLSLRKSRRYIRFCSIETDKAVQSVSKIILGIFYCWICQTGTSFWLLLSGTFLSSHENPPPARGSEEGARILQPLPLRQAGPCSLLSITWAKLGLV